MVLKRCIVFVTLVFTMTYAITGIGCAIVRHGHPPAAPLRVDINSEGRADMRTEGWENWLPSGDDMSQSFGDITARLRAGSDGGSVHLFGNKSLLVHGVTIGAEGVVATGGKPVVMEILLEGLVPGPHTFVGYHHVLGGAVGGGQLDLAALAGRSRRHRVHLVGLVPVTMVERIPHPLLVHIVSLHHILHSATVSEA